MKELKTWGFAENNGCIEQGCMAPNKAHSIQLVKSGRCGEIPGAKSKKSGPKGEQGPNTDCEGKYEVLTPIEHVTNIFHIFLMLSSITSYLSLSIAT